MTKKFLSILLAIVMVIGIVPVATFAEEDILDYLVYEIENGEVTITDYSYGTSQFGNHITIPDEIEGYPVTSIGKNYFGWTSFTSVTIPASVTGISETAIDVWNNILTSITVDDANEHYSSDNGVLFNKDKTELVLYPGGRTETAYIIPDSVTSIGDYAFEDCDSLTSITIPDSVTSIGSQAFAWCSSLSNITIPDATTKISGNAFYKSAYYNDTANWQDGAFYVGNCLLETKEDITECVIREGTVSIGTGAFRSQTSLTSITIPASVKFVGNMAFENCSSLKKVEFTGEIDELGQGAFSGCILLEEIVGFEYVNKIGMCAFIDCPSLKDALVFENNEVEIEFSSLGYSLFEYLADLEKIAEHLAQYGHGMYEHHSLYPNRDECESMYAVKQIEIPEDSSMTDEERIAEILKQVRDDNYTITGYRGSTSEEYAKKYGFNFVALGCYIHEYGDEEVLVAPTYTTTGYKGQRCKYCPDEINVVEIPCLEIEDSEEMEDADTGVSVIYPDSAFENADVEIEVTPVTDGDAYALVGEKHGRDKVTMFDINVLVDGEKVQPEGKILVKIPVPKGYDHTKCVVYYVSDDGTIERLKTFRNKDGYIYFETDHFSYYAVVEETEVEEETDFLSSIKSFFDSIKAFFENLMAILKNFLGIID